MGPRTTYKILGLIRHEANLHQIASDEGSQTAELTQQPLYV